jgi:hypothetical protein
MGGTPAPQASQGSAQPAQNLSPDDVFNAYMTADSAKPAGAAPAAQNAAQGTPEQAAQYGLGTGGASNFIDAMGHNAGNAVLGLAQTGLHGLSRAEQAIQGVIGGGTALSGPTQALDQFIQNREQNYQQNVPTNGASVAGAAAGQVLPFLASGGAGAITKVGQLVDIVAGMLGAGNRTRAVASAVGQAGGSSLLGLLAAGAQPVSDGGNFAQEKGDQALTGAAVGAVIPGATGLVSGAARSVGNTVGSLVRPFTEGGQQKIAANVLRNVAGDAPLTAAAESVPGVAPTLAEATGNPSIAAMQRALSSRPGNDALSLRQTANQEARNAYAGLTTGSAEDISRLQAVRDQQTAPMLQQAFTNASPVNPQPVVDVIDSILQGPAGKRDAIKSVLTNIRGKIVNGPPVVTTTPASSILDVNGKPMTAASTTTTPNLETDPAVLYQSVRKQIGDMLESQNPETRSNVKAVQRELLQVRDSLDDTIEQGAPGFAAYRQAYSQASQPITALRTLQNMNLMGPDGTAPVTLAKVRTAVGKVQSARDNPNSRNLDYQAVTDDQLASLTNLRDSLLQQQNLNAGQNTIRGSTTYQNLANGSILDAQQPALVRMLLNGTGRSMTTGGAAGGILGSMLGGPGGAAAGAAIGSQMGNVFGGAIRSKAPEVEARVLQLLLNPSEGLAALAPPPGRFPLAIGKNVNATAATLAGTESGKNSR